MISANFNDSVTACSWSPFNQCVTPLNPNLNSTSLPPLHFRVCSFLFPKKGIGTSKPWEMQTKWTTQRYVIHVNVALVWGACFALQFQPVACIQGVNPAMLGWHDRARQRMFLGTVLSRMGRHLSAWRNGSHTSLLLPPMVEWCYSLDDQ